MATKSKLDHQRDPSESGKCFQELLLLGFDSQIALAATSKGFDDVNKALKHLKKKNKSLPFINDSRPSSISSRSSNKPYNHNQNQFHFLSNALSKNMKSKSIANINNGHSNGISNGLSNGHHRPHSNSNHHKYNNHRAPQRLKKSKSNKKPKKHKLYTHDYYEPLGHDSPYSNHDRDINVNGNKTRTTNLSNDNSAYQRLVQYNLSKKKKRRKQSQQVTINEIHINKRSSNPAMNGGDKTNETTQTTKTAKTAKTRNTLKTNITKSSHHQNGRKQSQYVMVHSSSNPAMNGRNRTNETAQTTKTRNTLKTNMTKSSHHHHHRNRCKSVSSCKSIQNIGEAMIWYQSLTENTENNNKLIQYSSTYLLDDYHHILYHHLSTYYKTMTEIQQEFKSIYEEIVKHMEDAKVKLCKIGQCPPFKRNNRDRNLDDEQDMNLFNDDAQIQFYIDTLDTIHCYFLHSYDSGMRVKSKYFQSNAKDLETEQKYNENDPHDHDTDHKQQHQELQQSQNSLYDTHDSEMQKLKSMILKRCKSKNGTLEQVTNWKRETQSKYFTKLPLRIKSKSTFRSEPALPKSVVMSHHFGYKYYYWDEYRDNTADDEGPNIGYKKKDWYIHKKYDNLKDEIINNRIYCLNMNMVNNVITKADKNHKCRYSKKLHSTDTFYSEYFKIKSNSPITAENLMAIILYCDYYDLTYYFKSTFRKISDIETHQQIKNRNREYWWWSKILTETIELYGKKVSKSKTKTYFHGVTQMTFPAFISYFCGPTSTTPIFEVAIKSSIIHEVSNGMLLELTPENEYSYLKSFNCSWLSCYGNECEELFFGGSRPLKFGNIRMIDTNQNYYIYMKALTLFNYVIKATELTQLTKSDITESDYDIILCLMKHIDKYNKYKNTFPKYVNSLFKTFCLSQKKISLSLDMLNNDYPGFKTYLVSNKVKNLILINYVVRIFSLLKELTIYNVNNMNDMYLKSLIAMFENLEGIGNLVKLKLHNVRYAHECLDSRFLAKYSIQFRLQAGCKISIDIKDRLIFNEQTKTWTKIIEHTDLIIIRNTMLQNKLKQINSNGYGYKNKSITLKRHQYSQSHHHPFHSGDIDLSSSDKNDGSMNGYYDKDSNIDIHRTRKSFGRFFAAAAMSSDTDMNHFSDDTENTLTSSRKHAGILHKTIAI